MPDDIDSKLNRARRIINRRKRDISDDTDIKMRDYDEDDVMPYTAYSDRFHRMADKIMMECSTVQNYGPSLIIDEKDLDSTGGVYIP